MRFYLGFLSVFIFVSSLSFAQISNKAHHKVGSQDKKLLYADSLNIYWSYYFQDTLKYVQLKEPLIRVAKIVFEENFKECKVQYDVDNSIPKYDTCLKKLDFKISKVQTLFRNPKDKEALKIYGVKTREAKSAKDKWKSDAAEKWLIQAQQKLSAKDYVLAYEYVQYSILHNDDYKNDLRLIEVLKQCIAKLKKKIGILPFSIAYQKSAKAIQIITSNNLTNLNDPLLEVLSPNEINKRTFELTNLNGFELAYFFKLNFLIILKPKLIISEVRRDTTKKTVYKIDLNQNIPGKFDAIDSTNLLECHTSMRARYIFEFGILNESEGSSFVDSVFCSFEQNTTKLLSPYKISELSNAKFNGSVPDKVLFWQKEMLKKDSEQGSTLDEMHSNLNDCISNQLTEIFINIFSHL